jgi:hypothetical protein
MPSGERRPALAEHSGHLLHEAAAAELSPAAHKHSFPRGNGPSHTRTRGYEARRSIRVDARNEVGQDRTRLVDEPPNRDSGLPTEESVAEPLQREPIVAPAKAGFLCDQGWFRLVQSGMACFDMGAAFPKT